MKKVILFCGMFLIGINVFALDKCTTERLEELKKKASLVEFEYQYHLEKDNYNYVEPIDVAVFNINILNDDKELSYTYKYDTTEFSLEKGTNTIKNLSSGQMITIYVYAYTKDDCCTKLLRTKTIKLPYYNDYYSTSICKDNKNFKYCKEFVNTQSITDEVFNKELESYKNQLNESDSPETIVTKLVTKNYIMYIFTAILILVFLIIFILIKKRKKDNL